MESVVLTELAKYGLLGVLLIVAGWVIWSLKGEVTACWKDRIADWRAVQEILHTYRTTLQELVATTEARTRAQETMSRAQELSAAHVQNLTTEVLRLREVASDGAKEIARLREVLASRQGQ